MPAVGHGARVVPASRTRRRSRPRAARAGRPGTVVPVCSLIDRLEARRRARCRSVGGRARCRSVDAARVLDRVEDALERRRRGSARRPARRRRTSRRSGGSSPRRSARLPVCSASPRTVASLRPRLRMVSIMPGIETRRAGAHRDQQRRSRRRRTARRARARRARARRPTCSSQSPRGYWRAVLRRSSVQTSVVIVKPGGTGRPRRVISARLAPLPPSRSFILAPPSAWRLRRSGRPTCRSRHRRSPSTLRPPRAAEVGDARERRADRVAGARAGSRAARSGPP